MKTSDDLLKIKAAMLYVLSTCGKPLDYIKFYKLLYFAQQLHLVKYGRGIFRDSFYARERGPVPGLIYNIVKKVESGSPLNNDLSGIAAAIKVEKTGSHKYIVNVEDPDTDELSASDIECLDYSIEHYSKLSSNRLSALTHEDRAWQEAKERSLVDPEQNKLSLLEIARSGGASEAMLNYIKYRIEMDMMLPR